MDDDLLDTSWTLHYVPKPTPLYHNIFKSPSKPELQTRSNQLVQYLASHRPQYKDDLDDENEKLGSLKECKWSSFFTPVPKPNSTSSSSATTTSISILLSYQNQSQPYRYILYSPYLLLTKSTSTHSSRLFAYLNHSFDLDVQLSTHTLKLTPPFLSSVLSSYLTNLLNPFTGRNSDSDNDIDETNKTFVLRAAVNNLKLTLSFSGPVAPDLRTVDVDVPFDSIDSLVKLPPSSNPPPGSPSGPDSNTTTGTHFLSNLSHHLTQQTGLKLPLLFSTTTTSSSVQSTPTIRLSKITTTAFAISAEGKIKFSKRAIENAVGFEDLVRSVDGRMMGDVDGEARRRSGDDDDGGEE